MDKGRVRLEPSTNLSQTVYKMADVWLLIGSFLSHCKLNSDIQEKAESDRIGFWRERMAFSTIPAAKTQSKCLFLTRGSAGATPLAIDYAPVGAKKIKPFQTLTIHHRFSI